MTENQTIPTELVPAKTEVELVAMIAEDMRPKEIAQEKQLKPSTIEAQIFYLKKKFGKKTNAGLVSLFMRNKLID